MVGIYAERSPACVSIIGSAVIEPPPASGESTKNQLQHGRALMELLKQPVSHPFSMAEQVIILVSANAHIFSDVELADIKTFRKEMLTFFKEQHSDIINTIESTKDLTDETK